MPRSGGKSPWGSVVITQRGQGPVTFRQTWLPMANAPSAQPFSGISRAQHVNSRCTKNVHHSSIEERSLRYGLIGYRGFVRQAVNIWLILFQAGLRRTALHPSSISRDIARAKPLSRLIGKMT